jgi:E3 ubiquitin-protein ligase MARCH6
MHVIACSVSAWWHLTKNFILKSIHLNSHPLFKPCKCSGSIGFTHQDCLQQWLKVQRNHGRCELCQHPFSFTPLYAVDAPTRLSSMLLVYGITRSALQRWVPFFLRSLFCLSLWLCAAPLLTSWLYHAWMHRPMTVLVRMRRYDLITLDMISGAVIVAFIIISFLSLMSFADFVRIQVQPIDGERVQRQQQPQIEEEPVVNVEEAKIDDGLWVELQRDIVHGLDSLDKNEKRKSNNKQDVDDRATLSRGGRTKPFVFHEDADDETYVEDDDEEDDSFDEDDHLSDDDDEEIAFEVAAVGEQIEQERNRLNGARLQRAVPHVDRVAPDAGEEVVEMDINIALDELLGVRGPVGTVVRNLMWLLAFNAIYLGLFAFTPGFLGMMLSSYVFRSKSILFNFADVNNTVAENSTQEEAMVWNSSAIPTIVSVLSAVEAQSARLNASFRLSDMIRVFTGYATCALCVLIVNILWALSKKFRLIRGGRRQRLLPDIDELREAVDEINRVVVGRGDAADMNDWGFELENGGVAFAFVLKLVLNVATAVLKVGILLMLKMFLLPVTLGLCLDAATICLFSASLEDRIMYAGADLFSFTLLHWVAGITFMLLVTVSVLQLREVVHPDLLAIVVRPQEPQPDLLGNLLNETVITHSRRMCLSLIIYAILLLTHIYLPIQILIKYEIIAHIPRLRITHILAPQLQVPLELLFFHLCMLGLLEKNKNLIGELQHYWLRTVGSMFGVVDCILPRDVGEFRLIGEKPVFNIKSPRSVDSFWIDLAKSKDKSEEILEDNLSSFPLLSPCDILEDAETKLNGERILRCGSDFIKFGVRPANSSGHTLRFRSVFLTTKIGRYRLKRDDASTKSPSIQVWAEVPGELITRPPEGWDDLGAGGAAEQGRWAWGKEKKSTIERGVACRTLFMKNERNIFTAFSKIVCMIALSWITTFVLLCFLVATPLLIGRGFFYICRTPDALIHDPFAYALGSSCFFPLLRSTFKKLVGSDISFLRRVVNWMRRYEPPPIQKSITLTVSAAIWLGAAPLMLGSVLDVAFIKPTAWFNSEEEWVDLKSLCLDWILGIVVLSVWSQLSIAAVFDKGFWSFFGVGARGNAAADAPAGVDADRATLDWQGEHGRTACFFEVWKHVIVDFEWDKVDPAILLDQFALPILRQLSITMLILSTVLLTCDWWHILPGLANVIVRSVLYATGAVQIGFVWKDQVRKWLQVAHDAARDDLYLVGEVLVDYNT